MMFDGKPFVYRLTLDHTIESVCTVCFLKVCNAYTPESVRQAEANHFCPGYPIENLSVFDS